MELRHLRYFVAVAEQLHFAKAADLLHMTQPALSQQIKALEDELGVRLFDRTKREVTLTKPGVYFLAEANLTLKQAEQARLVVQKVARGELGSLRVAYVPSLPFSGLLSEIAAAFRRSATEIELIFEEMIAYEQMIKIADGKVDIGILRLPVQNPSPQLVTKVLMKEKMVIAIREDHPIARLKEISVADLRREDFVIYHSEDPKAIHDHVSAIAQKGGFPLRVAQSVSNLTAMIALVAGGVGVAYVPESLRNMSVPLVCFRPLADLERLSEIAVCYRSDESSLAVWKFLQMLDKLTRSPGKTASKTRAGSPLPRRPQI
jgi:DNA-binding transcriptional LysR family regulator